MSLKDLLEKLENLANCTLANCKAESTAFAKHYNKESDPIIRKLKTLRKNKTKNAEQIAELLKELKVINLKYANNKDLAEPVNKCTITHCTKELKENFLAVTKVSECTKKQSKECEIKKAAHKLAVKKKITPTDIQNFKNLELK